MIIVAAIMFCACSEDSSRREHFITDYFTYHNINVAVIDSPKVPEWGHYVYRFLAISADIDDRYRYNETDESRKAIYEQLAEKYGDVDYDISAQSVYYHRYQYAVENIAAIELICLEDVGEKHPAGSSVAEMFEIECRTPYDYIQSRYTNFYNKKIVKRLDQVTKDDLYLMGLGDKDLFALAPIHQDNCPAWGKKLRLTLNYENQYPISKDFILTEGEY